MPGRLFLTDLAALAARFDADLKGAAPRRNIAPGQDVLVWTGAGMSMMRWGIIPVGRVNARGRPVMETIVNARSETLFSKSAFEGTGRAVIPANGWYEWTGARRRKTAWRIAPKDGGLLFFAAITDQWVAPGGQVVPQVAVVTCAPNSDLETIHGRMGVLLEPAALPIWLGDDPEAASALMRPWPAGRLSISRAEDVDWDAP